MNYRLYFYLLNKNLVFRSEWNMWVFITYVSKFFIDNQFIKKKFIINVTGVLCLIKILLLYCMAQFFKTFLLKKECARKQLSFKPLYLNSPNDPTEFPICPQCSLGGLLIIDYFRPKYAYVCLWFKYIKLVTENRTLPPTPDIQKVHRNQSSN